MTHRSALATLAMFFAVAACKSDTVTWTAHDAGPLSLEYPCKPETSAAVTKCMRPDGTVYSLAVVEKGVSAEQALQDTVEYAKGLPKTTVLTETFPVKFVEERQFGKLESAVYYLGGKEYTASVQYSSQQAPPQLQEFFSKVKVK